MKKRLALFAAILLGSFFLASCSGGNDNTTAPLPDSSTESGSENGGNSTSDSVETDTEANTETNTEEVHKLVEYSYVFDHIEYNLKEGQAIPAEGTYDLYAYAWNGDFNGFYKAIDGKVKIDDRCNKVLLAFMKKDMEANWDNLLAQTVDLSFEGNTIKFPVDYNPNPTIASLFNHKSYSYRAMETNSLNSGSFSVYNDVVKREKDGYVDYIDTRSEMERYICGEPNDLYYIDQSSSLYYDYVSFFPTAFLYEVDPAKITYSNGQYDCNQDYLYYLGYFLVGYDANYTDFDMTVANGVIESITIKYTTSKGEQFIKYIFDSFDDVSFDIPTGGTNMDPVADVIDIKAAHELLANRTITIKGAVTAFNGNNLYIQDTTGGMYLYFGAENPYLDGLKIGMNIVVKGVLKDFKGIRQLGDIEYLFDIESNIKIEALDLPDIAQETLASHIHELVNISNVTLETKPVFDFSNNYIFNVSAGAYSVDIHVSKYLSNDFRVYIANLMDELTVGDIFSITNLTISKYNNYQLELNEGFTLVPISSLSAQMDEAAFEPGEGLATIESRLYLVELKNEKYEIVDPALYTIDSSDIDVNKEGIYTIAAIYNGRRAEAKVRIVKGSVIDFITNTNAIHDEAGKHTLDYAKGPGKVRVGLPTIGSPKVLVLPVEFSDSLAKPNMIENLNIAFNGTSEETGWESLNSYYLKSSYGKLNLTADIMPLHSLSLTKAQYKEQWNNYYIDFDKYVNGLINDLPMKPSSNLIVELLKLYDKDIDYNNYDYNHDGIIDAIYLITTADVNYEGGNSDWAWVSYDYYTSVYNFDGLEPEYYCQMPYGFLEEDFVDTKINVNASSLIHESGHLMGLIDLYDTDMSDGEQNNHGMVDMMDIAYADHCLWTKSLLGWVDPKVVLYKDMEIDLHSAPETGECIIIPRGWNGSLFTEYYIIEYYTPTGLNEAFAGTYAYDIPGIRIYHINAMVYTENINSMLDIFKYDNSHPDYRLTDLIEQDGDEAPDADGSYYAYDVNDLFIKDNYYVSDPWSDGSYTQFIVEVLDTNSSLAKIRITF